MGSWISWYYSTPEPLSVKPIAPDYRNKCTCGLGLATYRFERHAKDDDIMEEHMRRRAPKDIPELQSYWSTWIGLGHEHIIRYMACDMCITPNVRKYFAHHPDGWVDKIKPMKRYEMQDI